MNAKQTSYIQRVIWIVLDGVGAGELPDANQYGDKGSNTLGNLAKAYAKECGRPLSLPHLQKLGLSNMTPMEGIPKCAPGMGIGSYGKAMELSQGKDTTSGHWEMAGVVLKEPFQTFPNGFPKEILDQWVKENTLPGVLGNKTASGTDIINELGPEHIRTGMPILYTSADSVWQVAAHEEYFGLDRLYSVCKSARKICDDLNVGRVIARPFIGNPAQGTPFKRTYHRKDYAQEPPKLTYLDFLCSKKIPTLGIGKISNIYAAKGIQQNIDTEGNTDGLRVLLEQIKKVKSGLIFCNLIDFDMLYGHRRDVKGFGAAMEEFDLALGDIIKNLAPSDLLIMTADHGNDPTFPGTDHTREYAPILCYSPAQTTAGPIPIGIRTSFADMGATVVHALLGNTTQTSDYSSLAGTSFLPSLGLV